MGYTHYWRGHGKSFSDEQWAQVQEGYRKLREALPEDVKIHDESKSGRIMFNGVGEEGHETFLLELKPKNFEFCKTARKPYDLLVCATLLLAEHHAPGVLEISSDGDREEWSFPLAWARGVLEDDLKLPEKVNE